MNSKEKPKRIRVQGSDGRDYYFLCKREQHGDLRKDARMMEFNTMINRLLQVITPWRNPSVFSINPLRTDAFTSTFRDILRAGGGSYDCEPTL